jgi:thioredoxin-like negative regulator of GroEL
MIERLLAAEAALGRDELDHAQRLFGQVAEADPRNAIAVVGLARVLARRGDTDAARELLAHALELDPDEAAAHRLMAQLGAGQPAPVEAVAEPAAVARPVAPSPVVPSPVVPPPVVPPPAATAAPSAPPRRSLLDRLLGRLGLRRR